MLDRNRRADHYPWLEWKVRFFVVGAGLGVGGMVMRMDWLVMAAIIVLFLGFALRFLPGGRGDVIDESDTESSRSG